MHPFRLAPKIGAEHVKSYEIRAPRDTHFREGTCEEVECDAYRHGWKTAVDTSTELGARQAFYIRNTSRRHFTEEAYPDGRVIFTFSAGQRCFRAHLVPLEREPLYIVRDGDWRGNPRGTEPRIHVRPEDWVDDFANHQSALADRIERG